MHETSPSTIFERNESLCSYTMGQRFTLFASQAAVPFAFPLVIYQNNNLWLERKALKDKVEYRGYGRRCSTRVANYRHYLWRREGTAKNSDNGETRSAKTEREREQGTRADLFPATWQGRVCKLLPIWTSETGTRARLVRAGFTTVCFHFALFSTPCSSFLFFLPRMDRDFRGIVCIRCSDNEAKPTIYIPLVEFEAKLAVVVDGERIWSMRANIERKRSREKEGRGGSRKSASMWKRTWQIATRTTDQTTNKMDELRPRFTSRDYLWNGVMKITRTEAIGEIFILPCALSLFRGTRAGTRVTSHYLYERANDTRACACAFRVYGSNPFLSTPMLFHTVAVPRPPCHLFHKWAPLKPLLFLSTAVVSHARVLRCFAT